MVDQIVVFEGNSVSWDLRVRKNDLKIIYYKMKFTLFVLFTVSQLLFNFCLADHVKPTVENKQESLDILKIIYELAEEKNMRVISDLNMEGGLVPEKFTVDEVASQQKRYIQKFHQRYGRYQSFWGWYINNELNPLKPDETTKSNFWRAIWKNAVQECKRVALNSKVTISPFFLLDKNGYRGFEFLLPIDYEKWWSKTLKDTGIDILMLQDSGAEHLGFYTIAERRPFFEAFKNACDQAGCKLWLNVETGEVDAKTWEEALHMERTNTQKWVYTETSWLKEKLNLAAEFSEEIISWGYYPYMNPVIETGPFLTENIDKKVLDDNYSSYKQYYNEIKDRPLDKSQITKPLINGSLWWIPLNFKERSLEDLKSLVNDQLEKQKAVGFNLVWIVNAPNLMDFAISQETK